jgi:hypothetical protein
MLAWSILAGYRFWDHELLRASARTADIPGVMLPKYTSPLSITVVQRPPGAMPVRSNVQQPANSDWHTHSRYMAYPAFLLLVAADRNV